MTTSDALSRLAPVPAMASYDWEDGNRDRHVEAYYLGFAIDGRALGALISKAGLREYAAYGVVCGWTR